MYVLYLCVLPSIYIYIYIQVARVPRIIHNIFGTTDPGEFLLNSLSREVILFLDLDLDLDLDLGKQVGGKWAGGCRML